MGERNLPQIVIGKFKEHKARIFSSVGDWDVMCRRWPECMNVTRTLCSSPRRCVMGRDPPSRFTVRYRDCFDDAGQFRVGAHALCWIHAERLVHKLVPASDTQRNAVEIAKRMIWWFYRALKQYKLAPSVEQAQLLCERFDRIFKRASTDTPCSIGCSGGCFATRRAPARSRTPRNSAQHQRIRKRHPRLRHQKKNLRRDRQRHGSRRARHYAGALQNLHEVEVVVPRIHRRTPRHPRAKNPAPRKPHPASPCINSMALARKLAPITYERFILKRSWSGEGPASSRQDASSRKCLTRRDEIDSAYLQG